jgi:hypothetical protein
MKKISSLLFGITLVFLLAGCSAVQKATVEADAQAKTLSAPTGKALVYIVRPSPFGLAIRFNVLCDGTQIGATGGQRFIYTYQNAGRHEITSKGENTAKLEINLSAGEIYYIEQIPQMGLIKARNKLVLLDEASGKDKLGACTLSSENVAK